MYAECTYRCVHVIPPDGAISSLVWGLGGGVPYLKRFRLHEMAGYPVVVTLLLQRRLVLGAHLDGYGTPCFGNDTRSAG